MGARVRGSMANCRKEGVKDGLGQEGVGRLLLVGPRRRESPGPVLNLFGEDKEDRL